MIKNSPKPGLALSLGRGKPRLRVDCWEASPLTTSAEAAAPFISLTTSLVKLSVSLVSPDEVRFTRHGLLFGVLLELRTNKDSYMNTSANQKINRLCPCCTPTYNVILLQLLNQRHYSK